MLVLNDLDVVDGATMRIHASQDCHCLKLSDVPDKHHTVTIQCNCALIDYINGTCHYISKFVRFILLNLDAGVACLEISGTQRRGLAQT